MPDPDPTDGPPAPERSDNRHTSLTLLARIRNNDADAWRRVVHLYSPLVYYWCSRAGVRQPDADDVLQEVLRITAARLGTFRQDQPGSTFRGWLRGITRNTLSDYFRRVGREPRAEGGTDAGERMRAVADPATDEDDPPAELSGLYRRALELVRNEFEGRTWKAFWQTTVEGRRPADVAVELGVTPAAIRQAKSRVLRRLKEEIGDLAD